MKTDEVVVEVNFEVAVIIIAEVSSFEILAWYHLWVQFSKRVWLIILYLEDRIEEERLLLAIFNIYKIMSQTRRDDRTLNWYQASTSKELAEVVECAVKATQGKQTAVLNPAIFRRVFLKQKLQIDMLLRNFYVTRFSPYLVWFKANT